MFHTCDMSSNPATLHMLLQSGANPNVLNFTNNDEVLSALMIAIKFHKLALVKWSCEHGVNVNVGNDVFGNDVLGNAALDVTRVQSSTNSVLMDSENYDGENDIFADDNETREEAIENHKHFHNCSLQHFLIFRNNIE